MLAEHAGQLQARQPGAADDASEEDVEMQPLVAGGKAAGVQPQRPWYRDRQCLMGIALCTVNAGVFNYLDELRCELGRCCGAC